MLDYETFCQIRDPLIRQKLTLTQTARALGLSSRTVAKWAEAEHYRPRVSAPRAGKLDAFKGQIVRWLDTHPYSVQQIFQRLGEAGFDGGLTIVKEYVKRVRPRRQEAFLRLDFAAGECAQVDWGEWGTLGVGSTRRRLSFFVRVLCYKPAHVPGVHRLAADGVLPGLPRERVRCVRRRAPPAYGRLA